MQWNAPKPSDVIICSLTWVQCCYPILDRVLWRKVYSCHGWSDWIGKWTMMLRKDSVVFCSRKNVVLLLNSHPSNIVVVSDTRWRGTQIHVPSNGYRRFSCIVAYCPHVRVGIYQCMVVLTKPSNLIWLFFKLESRLSTADSFRPFFTSAAPFFSLSTRLPSARWLASDVCIFF